MAKDGNDGDENNQREDLEEVAKEESGNSKHGDEWSIEYFAPESNDSDKLSPSSSSSLPSLRNKRRRGKVVHSSEAMTPQRATEETGDQ